MISSFEINGFRAIRECKIDGLKRINIFMGRNNSGKSSILEALYLSSAAFRFQDPLNRAGNKIEYLLNRRCERGLRWQTKDKETLWHGYDSTHPIRIAIKHGGGRKLRIELLNWHPHPLVRIPDTQDVKALYKKMAKLSIHEFRHACFIESSLVARRQSMSIEKFRSRLSNVISSDFRRTQRLLRNMILVDTELIHKMEIIERNLWTDLLKTRLDKLVADVLRKGYDVPVEDLTYMLYGDKYQLAVKLPETTTRADDLGDGARYSMVLLMVAALAGNTAILVEEPENHQHPGGLAKSMEMLLDLIKKNNVQLFASTHSIEFSKIIEQIAKEKKLDLRTFFIERDKTGKIGSRVITPKDSEYLTKMGLDMRFLDIL